MTKTKSHKINFVTQKLDNVQLQTCNPLPNWIAEKEAPGVEIKPVAHCKP